MIVIDNKRERNFTTHSMDKTKLKAGTYLKSKISVDTQTPDLEPSKDNLAKEPIMAIMEVHPVIHIPESVEDSDHKGEIQEEVAEPEELIDVESLEAKVQVSNIKTIPLRKKIFNWLGSL